METGPSLVSPQEVYDDFEEYVRTLEPDDLPCPRERVVFGVLWHHIERSPERGRASFSFARNERKPRKRVARDSIRQRDAVEVLDTSEILRDETHPAPLKQHGFWAYKMWILKWVRTHREMLEGRLAEEISIWAEVKGWRKRN